MKNKIRKGDRVRVMRGDDKGKVGEVIRVFPKENQVVVQGVNLVKKHRSRPKWAARQFLPAFVNSKPQSICLMSAWLMVALLRKKLKNPAAQEEQRQPKANRRR